MNYIVYFWSKEIAPKTVTPEEAKRIVELKAEGVEIIEIQGGFFENKAIAAVDRGVQEKEEFVALPEQAEHPPASQETLEKLARDLENRGFSCGTKWLEKKGLKNKKEKDTIRKERNVNKRK